MLRENKQGCATCRFHSRVDRNLPHTACEALVQDISGLNRDGAKDPSAPPACGAVRVPAAVWAAAWRSARHSWRQTPGFQESPGVTVSLSDRGRVGKHQKNHPPLPTSPPPSPAPPWMRARPTCRCWSGKESGGSGRADRRCIWRRRSPTAPGSRWCSGVVTMLLRNLCTQAHGYSGTDAHRLPNVRRGLLLNSL